MNTWAEMFLPNRYIKTSLDCTCLPRLRGHKSMDAYLVSSYIVHISSLKCVWVKRQHIDECVEGAGGNMSEYIIPLHGGSFINSILNEARLCTTAASAYLFLHLSIPSRVELFAFSHRKKGKGPTDLHQQGQCNWLIYRHIQGDPSDVAPNLLFTTKQNLCFSVGVSFWCQQEVGNYLMGHPVWYMSRGGCFSFKGQWPPNCHCWTIQSHGLVSKVQPQSNCPMNTYNYHLLTRVDKTQVNEPNFSLLQRIGCKLYVVVYDVSRQGRLESLLVGRLESYVLSVNRP